MKLALIVILLRFAFCTYRAATQSITHDEAFTYLRFVSGDWSNSYQAYDANNHILYTILARISVWCLGNSEFSLRLPSLIAGLALSVGVYFVLRPIRSQAIRSIAFLAILLHPLLLDFSVAARGYGLSLALLVWASYFTWNSRYVIAGILLGLTTAANLTAAFPAIAMILAAGVISLRVQVGAKMAFASLISFLTLCYLPLQSASPANFYVGLQTLTESVFNLVLLSIRTNFARAGMFGTEAAAKLIQQLVLPFVIGAMFLAMRSTRTLQKWLAPLTLCLSIFGLVAAHQLFAVLYPADRTGLWLIPLFFIAWAFSVDEERLSSIRLIHAALAIAILIQFGTQIQTRYFVIWAFDQHTSEVAEWLKKKTENRPQGSVSVSTSMARHPAMEYYRMQLPIPALQPIKRQAEAPLSGHDYYVLSFPDSTKPQVKRLRALQADMQVGDVFAAEP